MSDIQKNFIEAIDSFISNDTDLVDAFGERYGLNRMEQGTEFPYLVYTWVNNISTRDSKTNFENPLIEFSIVSDKNAPTEVNTLTSLIIEKFNSAELNVSGYTTLKFRKTNDFFAPAGAESRQIWDKRIRFETNYQEV